MRKSNLELPSAQELFVILAQESQRRAVKYDFLQKFDFYGSYKTLAKKAHADVAWLDGYASMDIAELSVAAELATGLMARYIHNNPRQDYAALFDQLAINTAPKKADIIFVFGSPANARIEKAVNLYKEGYAKKIVITGHSPVWSREQQPEAERMYEYAISKGVSPSALMVESESITLPDNVKRTLDLFDNAGFEPSRVIIVASTFILRRAYMEWYKFTPWGIEVIPVSPDDQNLNDNLRRNTWYVSEKGVWMLLNEYAKIVIENKMDLIRREL